MEENGFHWLENEFPLVRIRSVFKKWFPLISVTVLNSRKELSSRQFPIKRKSLSNSWNEEFVKKYLSTRQKKILWLVLARKSISTTQNETFVEIYIPIIRKNCFFQQKNRKWFPLAGKQFSVKIGSPKFQSWFPTAEKSLRTNAYCFHQTEKLVSTSRNEGFVKKYMFTRCKSYFRWQ